MNKTNQATLPQPRDPFQILFNRLFSDSLPDLYGGTETAGSPRTNISENESAYELSFELPGLEEKDIHVNMQDHMLTVTAERKNDHETSGKRWHRVEHRYGQFARTISLPNDAAAAGIDAVYKQGVLTITVPKALESRPTKIAVKTA